jgi:hypothetical protein
MMRVKTLDGDIVSNMTRANTGLLSIKANAELNKHKADIQLKKDVDDLKNKMSNIERMLEILLQK